LPRCGRARTCEHDQLNRPTRYGHFSRYVISPALTGRPGPSKTPQHSRKAPVPMSTRGIKLLGSLQKKLAAHWQTFAQVIFGAFIGGLVVFLILLYAGVPIVGGV